MWKPSADGVIGWDSPWGRGRPGWHIECSAMIRAHLGETIDIHGGGLDLIFPHHENEIAQSRCAHGAPLARYWVHNGFVDMAAEKMSKSLGNVVTPEALLKSHKGETLRLALLSAHYRQPLAWTEDAINQAKTNLDRLYRVVGEAEAGDVDVGVVEALSDDLNTPLALARIMSIDEPGRLKASAALMGLLPNTGKGWAKGRPTQHLFPPLLESTSEFFSPTVTVSMSEEQVEARIAERVAAKQNRDFKTADRIRDQLKSRGIRLLDRADGTTDWERV